MSATNPHQRSGNNYRSLPKGVWVLGFGSLLMDTSSELVHSLLPVFMVSVLGASMVTVGLVEGLAEAAAAITKVFSGVLSDFLGRRKFLVVLGYGLAAITKPVFALATTMSWVFSARFVDRIGKGIRGAPRDALIADIVPQSLRGAAYGLRQALDTVGALAGPLLAVLLMAWLANDIRQVLWLAVVPAFLAVALLAVGLSEPARSTPAPGTQRRLTFADVGGLPLRFWLIVSLGAVFTLARFSEAFLVLRAQDVGLALGYVPMIMIVMNLVYALVAYPAGAAADRLAPRLPLLAGLVALIVADVLLALATVPALAFAGAAFWGLHMALTQGLFAKLVADVAPEPLRGTAFGVFSLVSGVALLLASVIAGVLWNGYGASATFGAGAAITAVAALGVLLYRPGGRRGTHHG